MTQPQCSSDEGLGLEMICVIWHDLAGTSPSFHVGPGGTMGGQSWNHRQKQNHKRWASPNWWQHYLTHAPFLPQPSIYIRQQIGLVKPNCITKHLHLHLHPHIVYKKCLYLSKHISHFNSNYHQSHLTCLPLYKNP